MTTRKASHAGSWYSSSALTLSAELDGWLSQVPSTIEGQQLPILGARMIIAPHAGYSYSGPAAAWAYKSLDLSHAKRIFLLGPSHALYLPGCALSRHAKYATPFGDLAIDHEIVQKLKDTGRFDTMSSDADETEHSMEMHLPYIHKMLSQCFEHEGDFPKLVPILVGNTSQSAEEEYGRILSPYLKAPDSVFIVSSDFCHWGLRFQYTYYLPSSTSSATSTSSGGGYALKRRDKQPINPPIHESIKKLDRMAMDAVETGKHTDFLENLRNTGNTVCGRHPIGVVMAAVEHLRTKEVGGQSDKIWGRFKFVRYERSSEVEDVSDSSVSYASAFAVL